MDREYIQLCAEMAYNDVIIESVLNEEYNILNEGNVGERIKSLINNFVSYCKMLWNKIISFISKKIKEFKAKIEEIKKKKESNSTINDLNNAKKAADEKVDRAGKKGDDVIKDMSKLNKEMEDSINKRKEKLENIKKQHESVSLFDQLMEMVLTEEDDTGKINWNYVYDIMYASYFSIVDSVSLKLHGMINDIDTILMNSAKKDMDKKDYDKIIDLIDEKTEVGFSVPTELFSNVQLIISKDTISTFNRNYNIIVERSRKIKDDDYNPKYTDFDKIDKIEKSFKSMEETIQYYMKTVSSWSSKYNNENLNDLFEKLVSVCIRDCKKVLDGSSMLVTTASTQLMQIKLRCEIES